MLKDTLKNLEMRLRALAPGQARRVYRALRSFEAVEPSRDLPEELIRDCRFCVSRVHMLDELPRGGAVAELGTYRGDFARVIVERCAPRELRLIDIDFTQFDDRGLDGATVKRHNGLTYDIITTFPDDHFDWIYVDGDHSYAGALRDARAAAPKVRPGGFLVFNDFAHIDQELGRYGVQRAVVDFALEALWPFHFFAYHPGALYDVALCRPQA